MDAALPLHLRVDALAFNDRDHFLVAAHARLRQRHHFNLPFVLLGEARIHAEDLRCKQRCLVAARSRANFENYVLLVVGVLGQQQNFDLFFELRFSRRQRDDLFLGHGAHFRIALRQHGARFGQSLAHLLEFAKLLDRRFQLAQGTAGLLILFVVGNNLWKPELGGEVIVTLLHLLQTVDHGEPPLRGADSWFRFWQEKGAEQYGRRAPLEECRDGLVEDHAAAFILTPILDAAVNLRDSRRQDSSPQEPPLQRGEIDPFESVPGIQTAG